MASINIPFVFDFLVGDPYAEFRLSTRGYLSFLPSDATWACKRSLDSTWQYESYVQPVLYCDSKRA